MAVDASGKVVWLYDARENLGDFRQLANGNVIYLAFDNRAVEIDLLGNVVAQWYAARRWPEAHAGTSAIPVDTDTFHHEIYEMPNGNLEHIQVDRNHRWRSDQPGYALFLECRADSHD